jgi:hypothetical protein
MWGPGHSPLIFFGNGNDFAQKKVLPRLQPRFPGGAILGESAGLGTAAVISKLSQFGVRENCVQAFGKTAPNGTGGNEKKNVLCKDFRRFGGSGSYGISP